MGYGQVGVGKWHRGGGGRRRQGAVQLPSCHLRMRCFLVELTSVPNSFSYEERPVT